MCACVQEVCLDPVCLLCVTESNQAEKVGGSLA